MADCIPDLVACGTHTLSRCSINVCGAAPGSRGPSSLAPGFTEPATSCLGRCTPLPCCTASVDRQLCHVPASLEFLGRADTGFGGRKARWGLGGGAGGEQGRPRLCLSYGRHFHLLCPRDYAWVSSGPSTVGGLLLSGGVIGGAHLASEPGLVPARVRCPSPW